MRQTLKVGIHTVSLLLLGMSMLLARTRSVSNALAAPQAPRGTVICDQGVAPSINPLYLTNQDGVAEPTPTATFQPGDTLHLYGMVTGSIVNSNLTYTVTLAVSPPVMRSITIPSTAATAFNVLLLDVTASDVGSGHVDIAWQEPQIEGPFITCTTSSSFSVVQPTLSKNFAPPSIVTGGTSTLHIAITNSAGSPPLSGVGFVDTLPSGLQVLSSLTSQQCGGTVSNDAGAITFTDGTVAAGASSCTIDVPVTSTTVGSYTNSDANLTDFTSTETGPITIPAGSISATLTVTAALYLPFITRQGLPDLVVSSLSIQPNQQVFAAGEPVTFTTTITNQGNAPAAAFWVDLYLFNSTTPTPPPANTRWDQLCAQPSPCYGLAWAVPGLSPGRSITLTSNSYSAPHSNWPGWMSSGTTYVYVYADSWGGPDVTVGAVTESNEGNNTTYLGPLTVSGTNPAQTQVSGPANHAVPTISGLPQRPHANAGAVPRQP